MQSADLPGLVLAEYTTSLLHCSPVMRPMGHGPWAMAYAPRLWAYSPWAMARGLWAYDQVEQVSELIGGASLRDQVPTAHWHLPIAYCLVPISIAALLTCDAILREVSARNAANAPMCFPRQLARFCPLGVDAATAFGIIANVLAI
jgi:hypothetical protein